MFEVRWDIWWLLHQKLLAAGRTLNSRSGRIHTSTVCLPCPSTSLSPTLNTAKAAADNQEITSSAVAERPRDASRHWIFRYVTQDHLKRHSWEGRKPLLVFRCNCQYLVPFRRYSALNNGVTLKSGFTVVQGDWKLHHSKAWERFPIRIL